jgi:hypothetical protein
MFDAERLGNPLLPDFKIRKSFSRNGQQALVISRRVITIILKNSWQEKSAWKKFL